MNFINKIPPRSGSEFNEWFLTTKVNGNTIYQWYSTQPTKSQIRKFKKMCKKNYVHLYEAERILSMPDDKFKEEFNHG